MSLQDVSSTSSVTDTSAGSTPAPADTSTPASQPAPSADTQAPASQSSGDTPASTPDAPTTEPVYATDREGLLAAVKKVTDVAGKNSPQGEPAAKSEPAQPDPGATTSTQAAAETPTGDEPSEAELQAATPRTRARIKQLLEQRHAARTEVAALKADADVGRQINGYLTKNNISVKDANLGLAQMAALARGDHKAFLDGVMPYVELSRQALGLAVLPRLQPQVEAGEISDAAARELTRAELARARSDGLLEQSRAAEAARQQQEVQDRAFHAAAGAITQWESEARSRDPDYAKKAPMVKRFAEGLIAQHGTPTSPDAARALAQRAYEEVNASLAAVRPLPAPTQIAPRGAGGITGATPEPRSAKEAGLIAARRAK